MDRLGVTGECTCSTSKSPSRIHRLTREAERGPNSTRATDPLYGTGTARPASVTKSGTASDSSPGASTATSSPRVRSASASSCTWIATPLGTVQS